MARKFTTTADDLASEGEAPPALAVTEDPPPNVPPPAPPEQPSPQPAAPELLTPDQWARRKGLVVEATEATPWVTEPYTKGNHAAAAQLHGWASHAFHEQDPAKAFRLAEDDYDAALAAAGEFPMVPAHKPALPPGTPEPPLPKHIAEALAAKAAEAAKQTTGDR